MGFVEMAARGLVGILPYLGVAFVLLLVLKTLLDWFTPVDDNGELKRGNAAVGINRGGAYLGFTVAMSGSLILSKEGYGTDLAMFALDGVIALGVFAAAYVAFDWGILKKVNNALAIREGNMAVAVVELCAYLSMGLITSASFSGGGQNLWWGIVSAVLFSAIGLGTLVAVYAAYVYAWQRRAGCNVDVQVREGNLAAALDAGSLLLAMAVTLWFSISGDFTGWGDDLKSYGVAAVSSVVAVSIARGLAVLLLARGLPVTRDGAHHGNVAKSAIIGLASVGAGLVAGLVTFG